MRIAQWCEQAVECLLECRCCDALHRTGMPHRDEQGTDEHATHQERSVGRAPARQAGEADGGDDSGTEDEDRRGDECPATGPGRPPGLHDVGHPLGSPAEDRVGGRDERGDGRRLDPVEEGR